MIQRTGMRVLAFLALLAAATFHTARADAPLPGKFDHLVLAMSSEAAFCAAHGQSKPECLGVIAPGLALHGLWPSLRADALAYNACAAPPLPETSASCGIALPDPLQQRLAAVMPGSASCLQRHEWQKHGTCSGLDSTTYFDRSVTLAERFRMLPALSFVLSRNAGGSVAASDLWDALISDLGGTIQGAAKLQCDRRGGGQTLSEIQIALDPSRYMQFPAADSLASPFPRNKADHPCAADLPIGIAK